MARKCRVMPVSARPALKDLVGRGELDERGQRSVTILQAVIAELEVARQSLGTKEESCPCCGEAPLSPAFANEHLFSCPRHPAVLRLRAVRQALELAPGLAAALGLEAPEEKAMRAEVEAALAPRAPGRCGPYVPSADSLRERVEFFTGGGRERYPRLVESYARELEDAVETWERLTNRYTDPCRGCGAIVPLAEAIRHALACERHPAALAAARAEARLAEHLGGAGAKELVGQLLERERHLDGLAALVAACEAFNSDLGRHERGYCARAYVEAALGRACYAASRLVGLLPLEYRPSFDPVTEATTGPRFARWAWRALLRVRENGPTPGSHRGSDADAALLREVAEEAVLKELAFGAEYLCPACGRPGPWVHQVAAHVPVCPGHPATLRERAAEARLRFAKAVLAEKRPGAGPAPTREPETKALQRFWPSAWTDDRPKYTRDLVEQALRKVEQLVDPTERAKYPTLVDSHAQEVATLLSSWQRHRGAEEAQCPYCDTDLRFHALFAHMAECPAHPGVARAEAHEAALARLAGEGLEPLGRLRREADLARLAIARLAEFADSFTGSFDDDERGRAIVFSHLIPKWDREVAVARESLRRLGGARGG